MNWRCAILAGLLPLGAFLCLRNTTRRHPDLAPASLRLRIAAVESNRIPVAAGFNWRQVESADYRIYVANLRAIGCPEETIRDIVIADVTKLFAARKKTLLDSRPAQYWRSDEPERAQLTRARRAQIDSLQNEQHQLLISLLGPKVEEDLARSESGELNEHLEFLPSERRPGLLRLESWFRKERQAIYTDAEEYGLAPDRQRLRNLRDQRDSELSRLLSPAELFEYQLRADDVAERLRHELVGFDPTESEFREIFRLRKAHEEKFAFADPSDALMVDQQNSDLVSTEKIIKTFLGESRYRELQRSADTRFQEFYLLTQQFDLPPGTASSLYDRHQQMQREITRIQRDSSLNPEQRDQALRQFQDQAQAMLRESLSAEAYAQFQARGIEAYLGN